MKGYRFYLEYPNKTEKNKATVKNPGNHSGNCIAVFIGQRIPGTMNIECEAGLMEYTNVLPALRRAGNRITKLQNKYKR